MLKKKIPFILGVATATAGAFTGAMVSIEPAQAIPNIEQPVEEQPVQKEKTIDDLVINSLANQVYTGEEIKPPIYIFDGQKQLKIGTDYIISYSNNVNAGVGMIVVTFLGEYSNIGTTVKEFIIEKAQAVIDYAIIGQFGNDCIFEFDENWNISANSNFGNVIISYFKQTSNGLVSSSRYEMGTTIGNYLVSLNVPSTKNYTGATVTKQIQITPRNITRADGAHFIAPNMGTGNIYSVEYTGYSITPPNDLSIQTYTKNGQYFGNDLWTLYPGDYEILSISNNLNVGTATARIRCDNDYYMGEINVVFHIIKAQNEIECALLNDENEPDTAFEWDMGFSPQASATFGDVLIEYKEFNADDSTYSTQTPTAIGQYIARFSVEGTDNYYSAVETKSFIISRCYVDRHTQQAYFCDSTGNNELELVYTGNELSPVDVLNPCDTHGVGVVVWDNENHRHIIWTSDIISVDSFQNNINVGTATVNVTFMHNYSGTIQVTFKIVEP